LPPMLFPKSHFADLAALPPDARGKTILGPDMKANPIPADMARDIDTPEDLARYS